MGRINCRVWASAFAVFVLSSGIIRAQTQETVPLDSWIYPALEELRVRGYLPDLCAATKPYTRYEVYSALNDVRNDVTTGKIVPTSSERSLIKRLEAEFTKDDAWLAQDKKSVWRGRAFGQEKLFTVGRNDTSYAAFGGNFGLHFGQKATLFSSVLVDQELGKDPAYTGYRWRGMYGDFDAAYARVALGPARFFAGRGKLFWGPGSDESLILSGNAPALDQIGIDLHTGSWALSWFTAELDPLNDYIRPDTALVVDRANRFMVGHRADVKLGRRIELGASETFVYGGPDRQFELHYLNPLLLYHAVQLNDNSPGNTVLEFDSRWLVLQKLEIYGQLMIDDWQIEHKTPKDQKPNLWGGQAGFRAADPFGLTGTYFQVNYIRVADWVYNTYLPYERYIFKGEPLGYSWGNDGDLFTFKGTRHLNPAWDLGLNLVQKRHGQGQLDAPWPFVVLDKDTLTKHGFTSEPFPSGIVETLRSGELSVRWQPSPDACLEIGIGEETLRNERNVQGSNRTSATARLLARYQVDRLLP